SLAVFASVWAFAIVLVNIALMASYEAALKSRGAPGNLVIAYLVGSLFLFAGASVFRSSIEPLVRTGVLAALAFFTTNGRENTKPIEYIRGDVDRQTLPHRVGSRRAGLVAAISLFVGVALSLVPLALGSCPSGTRSSWF